MGNKSEIKKDKDEKQKTKWDSLRARGIFPPSSEAEAQQRLKEAHGY